MRRAARGGIIDGGAGVSRETRGKGRRAVNIGRRFSAAALRAAAFLLVCPLICAAAGCAGTRRYSSVFYGTFDTRVEVIAYCASRESFGRILNEVKEEFAECDRLFTIYEGYEGIVNLFAVNAAAGGEPLEADPRIIGLLELAKEVYGLTGGYTNAAMGAVLSLWHSCREAGLADPENAALPDAEALREASLHCRMEDVVIDAEAGTVMLRDPLMSLDAGAIAKGYAQELAARRLEEKGMSGVLINAGGSVRAVGGKKGGEWLAGIQDPAGEGNAAAVGLRDVSLVTSGSYLRRYTVDGREYHHIIDPFTLYPRDYWTSVSVIAADAGIADGLSTALFSMPLEEGLRLAESLAGTEVMWIDGQGEKYYSSGFGEYMRDAEGTAKRP